MNTNKHLPNSITLNDLPPEIINMIIMKVDNPKDYGSLLISGKIFPNSLNERDLYKQQTKFTTSKVSKRQRGEDIKIRTTTYLANGDGSIIKKLRSEDRIEGRIVFTKEYSKGILSKRTAFYPNNSILYVKKYDANDKRNCTCEEYFISKDVAKSEKGPLRSSSNFVSGMLFGDYKEYYSDGILKYHLKFSNYPSFPEYIYIDRDGYNAVGSRDSGQSFGESIDNYLLSSVLDPRNPETPFRRRFVEDEEKSCWTKVQV